MRFLSGWSVHLSSSFSYNRFDNEWRRNRKRSKYVGKKIARGCKRNKFVVPWLILQFVVSKFKRDTAQNACGDCIFPKLPKSENSPNWRNDLSKSYLFWLVDQFSLTKLKPREFWNQPTRALNEASTGGFKPSAVRVERSQHVRFETSRRLRLKRSDSWG